MKTFFLVLALVCVAVQGLTDEQKEKLRNHAKTCVGESGVDSQLVVNLRTGDYSNDDPKLQKFAFCMLNKIGLMSEDGVFHRDIAVGHNELEKQASVGKAIDACLDKKGSTNEETAWKYIKCYHAEKPDHDIF